MSPIKQNGLKEKKLQKDKSEGSWEETVSHSALGLGTKRVGDSVFPESCDSLRAAATGSTPCALS